jgi:hypothetical protein
VTAVASGVTIASGVDAIDKHDAFLAYPTERTESEGRAAETRTNVLLGVTGAAAVTTAVLGLFVVRWSGGGAAQASAAPRPGGLQLGARARF